MRERFGKCIMLFLILAMFVVPVSAVKAETVPQLINYNGTLTDSGGNLIADGNYDVTFNIYDAPTGGNTSWTEVWDVNTTKIIVSGGGFNAMLGAHNSIPSSFFSDNPITYLGVTFETDSEMLPRQRITSVGYAFNAGNGVPKGGVIMWSGSVDDIPDGWALCDGDNGTPDLKDKFVLGAGGAFPSTGGTASINLQHSHTVNNHTHTYSGNTGTILGEHVDRTRDNDLYDTAGNDHYHSYSGTTGGASDRGTDSQLGSTSILPPYYALAFIMKL